ncbi:MAG: hypothetical protein AB1485_06725 [Candidatus Thermoplasmatota archaeon]
MEYYKQWYPCPFCGEPLSFIEQYKQWYCYRCGRYASEALAKSHYPELYAKPEEEHRLKIGILPKILYKPKQSFIELYHCTGLAQGIIVAIAVYLISSLIGFAGATMTGYYHYGSGLRYQSYRIEHFAPWIIVGILVSILSLLAGGWLSAKFAKAIGKGRCNVGKTIGFLGYASVVGLVMSVVTNLSMIALAATGAMRMSYSPGAPNYTTFPTGFLLYLAIIAIIGIIGFVWTLWVCGTAVSVANDVSVGIGVVSYFLAMIIVGIIVAVIMAAALFAWVSPLM